MFVNCSKEGQQEKYKRTFSFANINSLFWTWFLTCQCKLKKYFIIKQVNGQINVFRMEDKRKDYKIP